VDPCRLLSNADNTPKVQRKYHLPPRTPLAKLPTMEKLMMASASKKTQLRAEKRRRNALAKSIRVSPDYPSESLNAQPCKTPEHVPPFSISLSTPPPSGSSSDRRPIPDYLRSPPQIMQNITPTSSAKKKFSSLQHSQYDSQFDVEHNVDDISRYIDDDLNPSFDFFQ